MTIHSKLAEIQQKLVAQKGQRNDFGGYQYRSAEDIMHAVKPFLGHMVITCDDDILMLEDRFYVKATVTISDGKESISVSAFAREPETVTKQAPAQTTGSSSSYARKYALSGLLLIDNEKDADVTETHGKQAPVKRVNREQVQSYMVAMLAAMEDEDATGMKQLMDELRDTAEQSEVWKLFNTKQKTAMKTLVNNVKGE